jgi:nitroimidazol reductase NimA-like FMN-containing flavoprotein (pyridoxamine 5'-phosphate oxidase superfamily)
MPAPVTSDSIWKVLSGETFAVIAWVSPNGAARSAGVIYQVRDGRLLIGAEDTSWKVRHIRSNPQVSLTVLSKRRIAWLPWIPLPDATITFHGSARIIEAADVDRDILKALEEGLAEDPEREAHTCLIEISPEGQFVTYGIDVPVMAMRDPAKAQGRAPVG